MESVIDLLLEQSWAQALIRLWVLAQDAPTLNRWESEREPGPQTSRIAAWELKLDRGDIKLEECERQPLELIQAVDLLLWNETAARAFSGTPYLDGVSQREFWLWRLGTNGRLETRTARQAGSSAPWFANHVVAPVRTSQGIQVAVYLPTGELADRFNRIATSTEPELKIWIGHFDDGCEVSWDRETSPLKRYLATGFDDEAKRRASLKSTLDRAGDAGSDLILLPEMSVDMSMRKDVVGWLQGRTEKTPLIVVPGSFHESIVGKRYNTSPLLDGTTGLTLFTHRKLQVYGEVDPQGEREPAEAISIGNEFHILATDIGTVGLLICKDFLDAAIRVSTLLPEVPVDWVVVPSYGGDGTRSGHLRRAAEVAFVTAGCNVAVANIRNLGFEPGEHLPGFVHKQGTKTPQMADAAGSLIPVALTASVERPRLKRIK